MVLLATSDACELGINLDVVREVYLINTCAVVKSTGLLPALRADRLRQPRQMLLLLLTLGLLRRVDLLARPLDQRQVVIVLL